MICMADAVVGGDRVNLALGGESRSVFLFDAYVDVLCSF